MKKKPLGLALDPELVARVDEARGPISRTRWIEQCIERGLDEDPFGAVHGMRLSPPPLSEQEAAGLKNVVETSLGAPEAFRLAAASPPLEDSSRAFAPPSAQFGCPTLGCDFRCQSPNMNCPAHGRRVRPISIPKGA